MQRPNRCHNVLFESSPGIPVLLRSMWSNLWRGAALMGRAR